MANTPGRTESGVSQGNQQTSFTATGNPSAGLNTGYNGSLSYNLASTGSYVKPTLFATSADISTNTIAAGAGETYRGIGLGYYSTALVQGNESNQNFRGFVVQPGGALALESNVGATTTVLATAAAPAGFSATAFTTLTYTVNTTTGAVTSVNYAGTDVTSTFLVPSLGVFTDANTSVAGLYGSTGVNAAFNGNVDNYSVAAVPEPTSAALIGLAGVGLLARRRRA